MGASPSKIVLKLSVYFSRWIILSNLFSWPLAWFILDRWLNNFAYRTNIGIEIFLMAGMISILISFVTIFYKTLKAARANPVECLKYE